MFFFFYQIPYPFHQAKSPGPATPARAPARDRKSTRLNSSHSQISYAVFCLKKKNETNALRSNNASRVGLFGGDNTLAAHTARSRRSVVVQATASVGLAQSGSLSQLQRATQ